MKKDYADTTQKMSIEEQGKRFGFCKCGHPYSPAFFIEENKRKQIHIATSHLECSICGKRACVDDSFDQKKWYPNTQKVRDQLLVICEHYMRKMNQEETER